MHAPSHQFAAVHVRDRCAWLCADGLSTAPTVVDTTLKPLPSDTATAPAPAPTPAPTPASEPRVSLDERQRAISADEVPTVRTFIRPSLHADPRSPTKQFSFALGRPLTPSSSPTFVPLSPLPAGGGHGEPSLCAPDQVRQSSSPVDTRVTTRSLTS